MIDTSPNLTISSSGTLPRVPFLAVKNKILGVSYELSIAFVPSSKARALNIRYRKRDYVPNTLAFPLSKKSGEITLCASELRKQYKNFDMNYDTFVLFIIIHSMLHLKGYAHSSTMERKERELLKKFTSLNGKTKDIRRN